MNPEPLNRILVVDDDPAVRELAQLALEGVGGFTVRVCASGHEALDAAGDFRPDLVLLDELMSGMDGLATLRALRARPETADVPVIFLTARTRGDDLHRYRAAGAAGLIAKPFSPMALADEVRQLWDALPSRRV
jgi:CheY-like chemotaxis protein